MAVDLADAVSARSIPLHESSAVDRLVEEAARARYVLLGEASHGTAEYYTWRAAITKRLVEEHGFTFVAVEGDWPACRAVDKWIRAPPGSGPSVDAMLRAFHRWPTWMWANAEVAALATWMQERNWNSAPGRQVGFFGLDVYSLWESLDEIVRHVEAHEPDLHDVAQRALSCFEPYGRDEQAYASATAGWVPRSCESHVVALLTAMREREPPAGLSQMDAFDIEQNALAARNAEEYYRTMVRGGDESWNVRDRHMVETLDRLMAHHGPDARCIVWEHNTHVGDARATDMAEAGMVNVGQLVREAHLDETFVVGFGSHQGSVIAAPAWGARMRAMRVPPARDDSWEGVLHDAGGDQLLFSADLDDVSEAHEWRGHRAIGVVYHPEREAWGNYVPTLLTARYDAFVFLDRTSALHPLDAPFDVHEVPDTYPLGE